MWPIIILLVIVSMVPIACSFEIGARLFMQKNMRYTHVIYSETS